MKAVFISYNRSLTQLIQEILDDLSIKGYTQWVDVKGRGSFGGEPREGSHIWPELNNAHITIVEDDKVNPILNRLKELDQTTEKQGLRAFVWQIEDVI